MLNKIDAVFIDAGGVLLKPNFHKIRLLFPELNLKEELIDKALYPNNCNVGAGLGPGDDDNKFVYEFAVDSGIPPKDAKKNAKKLQEIILFSEWIPRKPDEIKKVINYLKNINKKVAIVTNTENGLATQLLEKLKICTEKNNTDEIETVDRIIDSWIIGIHKPDPEIYTYTANELGVDITRCLHIGDSYRNDYEAGKKAGANVLLFRPYEKKSENSIQSLLDIIPKVKKD